MPTVIGAVIALLLARLSYLQAQSEYKSQQFQAMADFAFEFTYYRTLDGAYEYVSRSCEKITGYSEEEFYQKPNLMDELIHPEDMSRWKGHIHAINNKTDKPQALEIRIIKKDGSVVWIEHMCSPAFDDRGEQVGVRSTNLDITKRREAEQDIWLLAYFDPLTNLPNRRSLEQEIIRRIREAGRFEGFAILFLDMRRFKNINDSFGHEFGDKLLKALATRLLEIDPSLFVS
ncbi:MAG: diguanylate cyclase, partial [Chromatiales bacterium]|nr:diguanylate cyclase [Chromatiales bacterium]